MSTPDAPIVQLITPPARELHSSLTLTLLLLGCFALICVLVIVVVEKRRAKQQRQRRAAWDRPHTRR
jgi:hypothetical protein